MGLDQRIVRVANTDLEKFYAVNLSTIIAPHNPDLNYDSIHAAAKNYRDLENLYNQAVVNDDPEADAHYKRLQELFAASGESTVWDGRKENHIHQWVCNTASVESTNVEYILIDPYTLHADLETVINNPELAPRIMPTQSGFFFGSTEYDDYYFEGVKHLYDLLADEKAQGLFDGHSYFYWSWW
jgi:hypothetical protein